MRTCNFKYIVVIICIAFIHTISAQDLCDNYLRLPVDSLRSKAGGMVSNCMKDNDTCVLGVIEYCKDSYIRTDKRIYLEIIDSCWKHSDGFVSELISEVSTDLFDEKFEGWFKYVYTNRNDTNRGSSTIKDLFMESVVKEGKQNVEKKITSIQSSSLYTEQQKKYLKWLFEKANFNQ